MEWVDGDVELLHRIVQRDEDRILRAPQVTLIELMLPLLQSRQAQRRLQVSLVGNVVRRPRKRIDRGDVAAQSARQQPRAERKVLVVRRGDLPAVAIRRDECVALLWPHPRHQFRCSAAPLPFERSCKRWRNCPSAVSGK